MSVCARIPAVPLVTCDPYFSLWSPSDRLTDSDTVHWTGAIKPLRGTVIVDGISYRYMGSPGETAAADQQELRLSATASSYVFHTGGIRLQIVFRTPLLLDDLDLLSRPCSWVDFTVTPVDGIAHSVTIVLDANESQCWNGDQPPPITGGSCRLDGGACAWMGKAVQIPLSHSGDDVAIDWGTFHLGVPDRTGFETGYHPGTQPGSGFVRATASFGVTSEPQSGFFVLAYDDILSIQYFENAHRGYWARNGMTIRDAIREAIDRHDIETARCISLDEHLEALALASAGPDYALLCITAYRQSIAAHKLIADEAGRPVFLSKECFSNGCIGTVDVSYPSAPLFLLFQPELVRGMLRPVYRFARLPVWDRDYAPHDVGRYPYATGQVYGLRAEPDVPLKTHGARLPEGSIYPPFHTWPSGIPVYDDRYQMPVEECGNLLILEAAVCATTGDIAETAGNRDLLARWADYLMRHGADPGDQLCTDDFGGNLARNVNLAIKAAMGVAAYARILEMLGEVEEAEHVMEKAREMAAAIESGAQLVDHTALQLGSASGWSVKYNCIWDNLFDTGLFSPSMIRKEVNWYKANMSRYGLPLDHRHTYGKTDWMLWAAALAKSREDREAFVRPIASFLRETPDRVPFSDFYDTSNARHRGMQHRSVQGGIFMPLYKDSQKMKGWKDTWQTD